MHVSRYWSAYKSEYVNKYGDNEITFHLAFGSEYSLEKLQLEYDQFFIRASQQILSAHKYVGKLCCFSENKKKIRVNLFTPGNIPETAYCNVVAKPSSTNL